MTLPPFETTIGNHHYYRSGKAISVTKAAAKEIAIKHEREYPYHPDSKNNIELFIEGGSKDGAYMTIKGQFVEFRDVK